jgi:hypothetical protein
MVNRRNIFTVRGIASKLPQNFKRLIGIWGNNKYGKVQTNSKE